MTSMIEIASKVETEQPAFPTYVIVHYRRSAGDYQGWGLYVWGDAIESSEKTDWSSPKLFVGEDHYGYFSYIKLRDATQPVNFIVYNGHETDVPHDRSFIAAEAPEIWLKQGDPTVYTSAAAAQGFVTIHYRRATGDYGEGTQAWGLHLWGDALASRVATDWAAPRQRAGVDDYGAYYHVPVQSATDFVNFIVHRPNGDRVPDTREGANDRGFVPADSADVWLKQSDPTIYFSRAAAQGSTIIHYHHNDEAYGDATSSNFADYWGLHVWTGAATPTTWQQPIKPAGHDRFGVYFEVPLDNRADRLVYIIHKGDEKDLPGDRTLEFATYGHEVWVWQATSTYILPVVPDYGVRGIRGSLSKQRAHWVAQDTLAWNVWGDAANTYKLHYDPTGAMGLGRYGVAGGRSIVLTYDPKGLSDTIKARFPHLAAFSTFKINAFDLDKIPTILKGQIAVSAADRHQSLLDATGVQLPGVLDDLYTYIGQLGVIYRGDIPTLKVWAPTAKSVILHLFENSTTSVSGGIPMEYDPATGVWSITGAANWTNKFYLYEVEVFAPATGKVERNFVTDPYSISLSINSRRSQIVNLADASLKPDGWDELSKPELLAPEDIVLYELHVRDFSISDPSVHEANRGTFKAFTEQHSQGMQHLKTLAQAGLTHIHLLPVFDIATINENKAQWEQPDQALLRRGSSDSELQQAVLMTMRDRDGFNWGYDPYHYTTPEGSYSTDPDGSTRIREFREMVASLNQIGLRVVMDVVYNHTHSSGQNEKSVLDRVVPGYYHRLDLEGNVTISTCCENTATEHAMMEKLMIDSIVTWATAYKVDGFRFDLMGHHMRSNILNVRAALDALTRETDRVDGKQIYVYGEGWNFGEVAYNQRGINATQLNLPGTGIGTFNDRLRDAVRGGGSFAGLQAQGFINGLYYDPNGTDQGTPKEQRAKLLQYADQIRIGLTGNLRDYWLVDRFGNMVTGAGIDYNGQPTGYTVAPHEIITYIEAHDNETLFDAIQLKAPPRATVEERVRMHNLGISIVMLGQGIPFFQAGQDLLRSKSLDRNSYDSGDWFNRLDFTYNSNNWGVGLPPAENLSNWMIMRPLLANPALKPTRANILAAAAHFQEMLKMRKSSLLFRLRTAAAINTKVKFLNTGPDQIPGLIVMGIDDTVGTDIDKNYDFIVVLFNATREAQSFTIPRLKGSCVRLHPVQAESADSVVRTAEFNHVTGTFSIPPRTTAVFVR